MHNHAKLGFLAVERTAINERLSPLARSRRQAPVTPPAVSSFDSNTLWPCETKGKLAEELPDACDGSLGAATTFTA